MNVVVHRRHSLAVAFGLIVIVVLGLFTNVAPARAETGAMKYPVSGVMWGWVNSRCYGTGTHAGLDIGGNGNASVYAAYPGTVAAAGPSGNYGERVVITHANGYQSTYAHLRTNSIAVVVGQQVTQSTVLGRVGETGNASGEHLHFEVFQGSTNVLAGLSYTCNASLTRGASIPLPFPGLSANPPASIGKFDLNGDAKSDLLAVRNDGYLVEFFGNGAGGTISTYAVGPGWGTSAAIVHGDYNSDGAGDLLQTRADGSLYFYAGNYASGFTPTLAGTGWAGFSLLTGGVDFTGDGRPDLVGRASNSNLYAYPGNGQGGFGNPIQIGTNWSAFTALVAGDFNGDGRGDLAARNSSGQLWGYYGTSSGLGLAQQIGQGWNVFSTITGGGDYNSDGKADLIARNASAQTLWLYPGTGNGGFGAGVQVGQGWGSYGLIS